MKLTAISMLALLATAGPLTGATLLTNVAPRGAIVDVSATYNATFPASTVIDGNINEDTNATPVSYWLVPDKTTNAYFLLDLRGTFPVESIELYNTHNRQYYDRGTGPFIIFGGNAIQARPPSSGAVDRYYSFDGTLSDSTSNQVNAAFYDILLNPLDPTGSFSADKPAAVTNDTQSLAFTGGGEFLEIVDPPGSGQPTTYTIALWVKFTVVQRCNILLRTALPGELSYWSHQLRVNAAGQFEAYTWDGAEKTVAGTTVVQPDTWYHVVMTAQNAGMERLYVNGVEEGTAVAIGALWSGGDRWRIGCMYSGVNTPMIGQIDELGMWFSNPLSTNLIKRLSNGEKPLTVTNTAVTSVGYQIVKPQVIASGTLSQIPTGQPQLTPQTFPVAPPVSVRYLQFQTLGSAYTNFNVGLNEIRVMAQADTTLPAMKIDKAVFLTWPFRPFPVSLQSSPSLTSPVWTAVTNAPTLTDTNWGVYLMATNTLYYRLVTP